MSLSSEAGLPARMGLLGFVMHVTVDHIMMSGKGTEETLSEAEKIEIGMLTSTGLCVLVVVLDILLILSLLGASYSLL